MIKRTQILTKDKIRPSRQGYEVVGVFNPAAVMAEGETVLLLRVAEKPMDPDEDTAAFAVYDPERHQLVTREISRSLKGYDFSDPRIIRAPEQNYLTSISHIRAARSRDGVSFTVEDAPALEASSGYEAFGVEDPRVVEMGGIYVVTYCAASDKGTVALLATTKDFHTFEKKSVIFPPDNKDVVLFPQKIQGNYVALHRPSTSEYGQPDMWLATSPDMKAWGEHRLLLRAQDNAWGSARIGAGAPPILTDKGWLEIYHGATSDNVYRIGAMLLDREEPWKILARSREPLLAPSLPFEQTGFFNDVIFVCGATETDGLLRLYYGAADCSVGMAELTLDDVWGHLGI